MKKIILLIGLISFGTLAIGQTINSTNIVGLGDTVYNATDNAPSINIGTAGTGNTWNFSSLLVNKRDTIVFTHPLSIPCATTTFSSATHKFKQDTNFAFLQKKSASLELIGISNGTICVASENTETIIKFPSSYNSNFTDVSRTKTVVAGATAGYPAVDSVKVISVTNITSNFNASGTLTTPYGVFSTIRQYLVRRTTDTIYGKSALTGGSYVLLLTQKDTAYSHQYWSDHANAKFPLVSYDINAAGALTGDVIWTMRYAANAYASVNKIEKKEISVFPNPVRNELVIENDDVIEAITITNIAGKVVYQSEQNNEKKIDVDFLTEGVYVLTVKTADYIGTTKFIKQ